VSGDILFWGIFLLAAIVLMIIFGLPRKKKKKAGSEKFTIRPIPALEEFATRQGYAIESGTRLHLSAGTADMNTQSAAATLLAVTNMEVLARNAAASDRPLVATTGDGVTALLLQSRLHAVYQRLGLSEDYNPLLTQLTGPTPYSYAAGAMPLLHDEHISVNIVTGKLGIEGALLAEAGSRENAFFIGASTDPSGQAVLYPVSDQPLIGEEMFATRAIMEPDQPASTAGVKTQDVLRIVLCAMMLGGALLKLVGVL
jgi:hypothetical protein